MSQAPAEAFARLAFEGGPAWLDRRRREAFSRFTADGFPRPGDEEWRQTNVAAIAETAFLEAEPGGSPAPSPLAQRLGGPRLVLVDGHVAEPEGDGRILPLSRALSEMPDLLDEHLARYAKTERRPFAALNTAFLREGAVVVIAPGEVLEEPV